MELICMCGCVFLSACRENSGLPLSTSQLMDEVIPLQESSVAKEDVLDESVEGTQDMYINEIEITEAAQLFKSSMMGFISFLMAVYLTNKHLYIVVNKNKHLELQCVRTCYLQVRWLKHMLMN